MQTYTCMHLTFSYTIGIKGTRPRTVPGTEQHACVHKEICIHGLLKMHSDAHTCITQKGKGYKEFSTVWHFHGLISPSVAVNTSQWPSSSGYSLSIDGAVDGRKLGDQVSRFNQNQDEKPQNKILTFAVTSAFGEACCVYFRPYSAVHVHVHRSAWSRFEESSKEMLRGVLRYRQSWCLFAAAVFDAVMGIFLFLCLSLCCSSRRGQRAVIKLCLHPSLSPSLISWRASAAGCPRFTDHLPPPNQCRGCCPSTVEHYWHLLAWNGSATGGVHARPNWWFQMWDFKILSLSQTSLSWPGVTMWWIRANTTQLTHQFWL